MIIRKNFVGTTLLLLLLLFATQIDELKAEDPIKPLGSTNPINTDANFYTAKVIPPGKYRVIIWDHFLNPNELPVGSSTLASSVADQHYYNDDDDDDDQYDRDQSSLCDQDELFLASKSDPHKPLFFSDQLNSDLLKEIKKCFLHFYTIKTDEEGKFLVQKNNEQKARFDATMFEDYSYKFYLIPLNSNANPVADTANPDELYAAQQVYLRKNWQPIDSLCIFGANHCLINYFETTDQWNSSATSILNQWLHDRHSWELAEKENFFLIANFQHFIQLAPSTTATTTEQIAVSKISLNDAKLVTLFLTFLAQSSKEQQLWKRLRLADKQIVPLISAFCKIKWSKLIQYYSLTNEIHGFQSGLYFFKQWPKVRDQADQFANMMQIIEAFRRWIFLSSSQLSAEMAQIVHAWIEFLAHRTDANIAHTWWKWSTYELDVFHEIGMLFINAKEFGGLTPKKIKQIPDVQEMLDRICENIDKNPANLCPNIRLKNVMKEWRKKNCENQEFKYSETARPKCVICLTRERHFAFDPCGHLSTCDQCTTAIEHSPEPKCPICRHQFVKKLRIYHP